ncbi:DUF4340 domain-containing protein [Allofournierella sp.]|uniref:DUF4340 domain-containing protein n=1 Tax=Allofournierella sp. TaxID=1940256 RepID=UPI002E771BED|nr:DUF4340 domain-containing protein [Fournierella sp.]MEE0756283.1 DUF4340 domain-containing protein [Fournierella sp.]
MKTKQLLLIALLAVVALLAAGLVAVRSLDTEEADSASDEIDLAPFAPADIEAFGYTFGGETLEFASKETPAEDESSSETETTWYLTDDPDYELDQSAISTMLVVLGNLTAQRQFENTGEDYGFDEPILTAWVTAGGETYAWALGAENSVTGSMYLQVQGQEDTVYLVSVSALSALESTKIELAAPAPTPEPTEEPASEPEATAPEEDAETTSSPASDAAPEADISSSASESAASETAGEESSSSAAE